MESLTFRNGTKIKWNHGDDGGGSSHYHDFLKIIEPNGRYNRCLEWCAGCSAIGFSLLDAKIVNELVLMDKYLPALEQALVNAKNNNFDKVSIYNIDKIQNLPLTEKFDLIVCNPPHIWDKDNFLFETKKTWEQNGYLDSLTEKDIATLERLMVDVDLNIHKEFFSNIKNYMTDDGDIFISETDPNKEVMSMINDNGFKIINQKIGKNLSESAGNNPAYIFHLKK